MPPRILDLGAISANTAGPAQTGSGPSPISITLADRVGHKCQNRSSDVTAVQQALNKFTPEDGGPLKPLSANGVFDATVGNAISRFQNKWDLFELKNQGESAVEDGIVDLDGPTIKRLRAGPPTNFNGANELNRASKTLTAVFVAGRQSINIVQQTLNGGGGASTSFTDLMMTAFQRNFHGGKGKQGGLIATTVSKRIADMQKAYLKIQSNTNLVKNDLPNYGKKKDMRGIAFSWGGGVDKSSGDHDKPPYEHHSMNTIYLQTAAKALDNVGIAYVICHELGHYVDKNTLAKDVYFARNPKGYAHLATHKAVHNADCYAQFMFDCAGFVEFNALKHIRY